MDDDDILQFLMSPQIVNQILGTGFCKTFDRMELIPRALIQRADYNRDGMFQAQIVHNVVTNKKNVMTKVEKYKLSFGKVYHKGAVQSVLVTMANTGSRKNGGLLEKSIQVKPCDLDDADNKLYNSIEDTALRYRLLHGGNTTSIKGRKVLRSAYSRSLYDGTKLLYKMIKEQKEQAIVDLFLSMKHRL